MVLRDLDPRAPIVWESTRFGKLPFTPDVLVSDVSQVNASHKFDVVLLSVANLQSFQDACTALDPFLHDNSLIVIESTGFVLLELFVRSCYLKSRKLVVCSIMNESEVKKYPHKNTFSHTVLNNDQRIYLGTCTDESKSLFKASDSETYLRFYKQLQAVQEQLKGAINLLKSNNFREFMTYQWKLALPRIVLNPLSVIFEEQFPESLEKQILAKPLISGLVNEIFKIIKKMECKLIKGFENEANILKNWLAHYPICQDPVSPPFSNANLVFYNFYHQMSVDVDMLLLQPILLGDDHGVRTPYLENLYSIMCQLQKMNTPDESTFFVRKTPGSEQHLSDINTLARELTNLKLEKESTESQHRERSLNLKLLEASLAQKQQAFDSLSKALDELSRHHDIKMRELLTAQAQKESYLHDLDSQMNQRSAHLHEIEAKLAKLSSAVAEQQQLVAASAAAQEKQASVEENQPAPVSVMQTPERQTSKTIQYKGMETPDLSDFADVAVYGAALNGDLPAAQERPSQPRQDTAKAPNTGLSDKEKELQRREQALFERERELQMHAQPHGNGEFYDSQTGEHFQDASNYPQNYNGNAYNGYANGSASGNLMTNLNGSFSGNYNNYNGNHNGGYNGNGSNANGGFNHNAQYRHSFSLSGPNPYNGGPSENFGEQRPPHGLPANGFPQNSLPPNLRNPQRYQPNGNQYSQGPQQRPRRASPNGAPPQGMNYQQRPNGGIPPQQYQQMPQQMPQQMSQQMGQQMHVPSLGSLQYMLNQNSQTSFAAKKQNRRSAFPDQSLNIDYGGRGGMPMPSAGAKHKSMMPGQATQSPPMHQQKKSISGGAAFGQNQSLTLLRPPTQNGSSNSGSLTSHGSNTEESPKSTTPDSLNEINIEVPVVENPGKPLGVIAAPQEKKSKKRGFLKKH